MNLKSALKEIKLLFTQEVEVKFSQATLSDGTTVIESEDFKVGSPIFIISEDESQIPMPIGTYKTEDNQTIVVEEEGIIASIGASEEEAPAEKEAEVEAETQEIDMEAELKALKAKIAELEAALALSKTELEVANTKLSAEPAATTIKPVPARADNKPYVEPKTSLERIWANIEK